jgi:hypothetical protein
MTMSSLSIVFKGKTTGDLDWQQTNWLSQRQKSTHIIKITDEEIPMRMTSPISRSPIVFPDRISRRIEYHE